MSDGATRPPGWRESVREQALRNALAKREAGVPTYSVPEAAALLSVSPEHLYRLVQAGSFPAVLMGSGRGQGRYVIPAMALDQLLASAAESSTCVESGVVAAQWAGARGGVA